MEGVVIRRGGRLAYSHWIDDETPSWSEFQDRDVTAGASAFLFDPCRLEDGVILADLLAIVRGDETIQQVFRSGS